jgi:hypothetical protein
MNNNSKLDTSEVFAMFEVINSKLNKQPGKPTESVPIDLSDVNTMTERLERLIEEVRKPEKVEHHHRHTIGIHSNWFFLSWVALAISYWDCFGRLPTNGKLSANTGRMI